MLLLDHQGLGLLADEHQLLLRGQAVLADFQHLFAHLAHEARHAHHEELIEVVSGNGEKAQALQQGVMLVARLLKNPAIELQPGQFAIEETRGIVESDRRATGRMSRLGRIHGTAPGAWADYCRSVNAR